MSRKNVFVFVVLFFVSFVSAQGSYGNFSDMSWWSSIKVVTGFIDSDQRLFEFQYFFLLGLTAGFFIWLVVVAMGYDSAGVNALKRLWYVGLIPPLAVIFHYVFNAVTLDKTVVLWDSLLINGIIAASGGLIMWVSRGGFLARIVHSSFVRKFIKKNPLSGWLSFIAGRFWKIFIFAFLFAFLMAFPFIGRVFGVLNLTLIHGFSNYPAFFFQAITLAVVFGIIPQIVYSWIIFSRIKKRERKLLKRINRGSQLYEYQKGTVVGMKDAEEILEDNKFDQARENAQKAAEDSVRRRFRNV